MSETISSLLQGALSFLGSGGVTLGGITLADWAIPELIRYGTQQQMTVHKLPGGGRVIDVMGADPSPIIWDGMMLGPDAAGRAAELDALAHAGEQIELAWDDLSYTVVIERFDCEYRRSNWIGRYSISCTVQTQTASDNGGLLGSITQDIGDALGINLPAALADVQSAVGVAGAALSKVSAIVPGALPVANLTGALASAQGVASGAFRLAQGDMAGLGAATAGLGAGQFSTALSAASRMATSGAVQGFMGSALAKLRSAA